MMKRAILVSFFVSITAGLFSFIPKKENNQKVLKTIVVDAGHGLMPDGGHNGAKGTYSYEDDICLAISKELVSQLQEALPNVKIIETRTDENIVPLHRRAEIANENHGDLFISIHCNAMPPIRHSERIGTKTVTTYIGKGKKRKKVTKRVPEYRYWTTPNPRKGTETYIWGAHKNEDKEVAVRENAPMLVEEDYKENYGDVDPNSPEFIALALLKTKQFFKRSATLAGFVEDEFTKAGRTSSGQQQRQVGIWVLQATAMPSVLVETGFITNREEEDYLNSKDGQQEISKCVTEAVKNYIDWLEKQQQPLNSSTQSNNSDGNTVKDSKAFLEMIEKKENSSF
ncbi:MAG TPA: N-acetylmuramoyl-L-alanine amidase [Chitinophagaceae bacterium]|jgi:N-acetylmuramoyl-L-alanine amidase|nr:N-acetylmuramoyl-L-alanine amidase [Chitinophagaceae bacterium]